MSDAQAIAIAAVLLDAVDAGAAAGDEFAAAALRVVGARLSRGVDDAVLAARCSLLAARAWRAQGDLERAFASYRRTAGLADRDDELGGRDGAVAIRAWLGMLEAALGADTDGTRVPGVARAFNRLSLRGGFDAFRGTERVTRLRQRLEDAGP